MRYTDKRFLSDCHDETGSMVCTISTSRVVDMDEYTVNRDPYISGTIQVRDCGRQPVHLDFDACGERGYNKRILKLDGMIEQLQAMRNQYEALWKNQLKDIEFKKAELAKEHK